MMLHDVSLDEMFPRAEPVTEVPLPVLKTESIYSMIERKAQEKGIHLTPEHMEVIDFVLDFYESCDDCQNARQLADFIQKAFEKKGGRKYLYQLFPDGPLSTIHELADLPRLGNETDQSFGTRW